MIPLNNKMIPVNFKKIEKNFWEEHPDMKVRGFKKLYENDKSKNHKESSDTMWFLALCFDKDSKFVRLPREGEDGKFQLVGEDFMGDIWYFQNNEEVLERLIDEYLDLQYTPIQRTILELYETLDRRREVLKELRKSTNPKDWKDVDAMITTSKKLRDEIDKLKKDDEAEDNQGLTKGGAALSLND